MLKRNNRTTIGVSQLARYVDDESGFEQFVRTKPNAAAIAAGNDFHDKGVYRVKKQSLRALLIVGGLISAICIAVANGWIG